MSKKRDTVVGKFKYVKKYKKSKNINSKEFNEKQLRKKNKKLRKRCECNHIDSVRNKCRLKKITIGGDENGEGGTKYYKCQICGGKIIAEEALLMKPVVKQAVDTIYSAFAHVRLKYNLKDGIDRDITTALYTNARLLDIIDSISSEDISNKKNKKKKNKNKKGKKNKYYRVDY